MSCTSKDRSLPFEVLKRMFQNLVEKEVLKICLLVCKSWNFVAQGYFDRDISIKIKRIKYEVLMKDLPIFGQNVKTIKLRPYEFSPPFNEQNEIIWKTILVYCPNITSIYLLKSHSILSLLKALQDPGLTLNNLQKIEVKELESYSFDIQELFLQANVGYWQNHSRRNSLGK